MQKKLERLFDGGYVRKSDLDDQTLDALEGQRRPILNCLEADASILLICFLPAPASPDEVRSGMQISLMNWQSAQCSDSLRPTSPGSTTRMGSSWASFDASRQMGRIREELTSTPSHDLCAISSRT